MKMHFASVAAGSGAALLLLANLLSIQIWLPVLGHPSEVGEVQRTLEETS